MDAALRQQSEYFTARLATLKGDLIKRGVPVFDFGTGDPPFVTPDFIKDALRRALPEVSCYPSARGLSTLRQALAHWLRMRYGAVLDPESQILPIQGGKEAIFHLPLIAFIPGAGGPPKDTVIFGEPAYPVYRWGTLFAGARPLAQTLRAQDDYLLRLDRMAPADLARTRLVWINSPHNPTGAVAPRSYLEDLYAICRRHDILLCADECYSELYVEHPPTGMLEIGTEGLLVINSLSKRSGLTGYRSGLLAGDARWIAELVHFRNPMGVAPTDFVQAAAVAAWSDEDHVAQRRSAFLERRRLMTAGLRDLGLSIRDGQAGIFVWASLPGERDAEPYAARLAERGIIVCPGSWLGPGARDALRVALAPTLGNCARALAVWREVGLRGFAAGGLASGKPDRPTPSASLRRSDGGGETMSNAWAAARERIERAAADPAHLAAAAADVENVIEALDRGKLRVAEPAGSEWQVNAWVQQAILLYFRLAPMQAVELGPFHFNDKLPLKTAGTAEGVRVVPPATVRRGAYVAPGAILMPSYVNIGAHVGAGTMVDTWATVGSGAQIGERVHLSGGVGIGGVLEPAGARPVIVEDGCFIGSRCIIVEGAIIRRGAVLAAGVTITASTPIYDVTEREAVEYRGEVPERAVVIPGTRPKAYPAGTYQIACALIVGRRGERTDVKTALNDALRTHGS